MAYKNKNKKVVVVGGNAAGMSAASKARRTNPNLEISVFEKGKFVSYSACGLTYLISGVVKDVSDLILRTPEQFAQQGIVVHTNHEVTEIDRRRRLVSGTDEDGHKFEENYDKLIIATGGSAAKPPIEGIDHKNIFRLRQIEDALAIQEYIRTNHPKRAIVVGGGFIGLEMVEALDKLGLEVVLLEQSSQLLPNLDADMSALVEKYLVLKGITVMTENKVIAFSANAAPTSSGCSTGELSAVRTEDGNSIPADLAFLGLGVRPNVQLATMAGIEIGSTGAIAVAESMRTNAIDVYAAGDCAEVKHLITNKYIYLPSGTTANKQGRVAGENAAGGYATFKGIVGTAVNKVMDMVYARTGLTEKEAKNGGYVFKTVRVDVPAHASYYENPPQISVKLVYDSRNERLLGGQMVGQDGIAKRIDVLATALQAGMTIEDISRLDLSYAPPFAPVWDAILVAANVARRET
ncbi:NADH oxidase [Candidatus Poribacteria bacterium]|nr:NADH oxidase [Candidatus Poribacteria bacterium]